MTRRIGLLAVQMIVAVGLIGCSGLSDGAAGGGRHGRYVGIGTYAAGELWSRITIAEPFKDDRAATTADDEHVIVVVDSDTGEIRECGDYSGRCVSLNPWTKAIGGAPVTLTKHAAEVRTEAPPVGGDMPVRPDGK